MIYFEHISVILLQVWFLFAVIKYCDQPGEGMCFSYRLQVVVHHRGKSGKEFKAATMEKHCWLACSQVHIQPPTL